MQVVPYWQRSFRWLTCLSYHLLHLGLAMRHFLKHLPRSLAHQCVSSTTMMLCHVCQRGTWGTPPPLIFLSLFSESLIAPCISSCLIVQAQRYMFLYFTQLQYFQTLAGLCSAWPNSQVLVVIEVTLWAANPCKVHVAGFQSHPALSAILEVATSPELLATVSMCLHMLSSLRCLS